MKITAPVLFLALISPAFLKAGEPIFTDPFTAETKVPERRAMRGAWIIENGVANVTQDDELYKKFKDHGPIIFYDFPSANANFHYAVKPEGCKTVVFTLNSEDGHVFRFVTSTTGTNFRAFPPDGSTKSIAVDRQPKWLLPENEWTEVTVAVTGSKVTITFGDHEPVTVEHESYDREKSNFSIGFAYGSLAVKDVRVTTD